MNHLYIAAATACHMLALLNIHMLFERDTLVWLNVAMAVYLGIGGIALSLAAAYERIEDKRLALTPEEDLPMFLKQEIAE